MLWKLSLIIHGKLIQSSVLSYTFLRDATFCLWLFPHYLCFFLFGFSFLLFFQHHNVIRSQHWGNLLITYPFVLPEHEIIAAFVFRKNICITVTGDIPQLSSQLFCSLPCNFIWFHGFKYYICLKKPQLYNSTSHCSHKPISLYSTPFSWTPPIGHPKKFQNILFTYLPQHSCYIYFLCK